MSTEGSPPQQVSQQKSSGGKIAAFIGCGCLGIILVGAGFVAVLVFGVGKMLKGNDAYRESVALVQSNPQAIAALGEPIKPGFMVSGSFNFTNGEGTVDLTIPVSGPKGSGSLRVVGEKKASGPWTYSTRELQVEGQSEAIPLGP